MLMTSKYRFGRSKPVTVMDGVCRPRIETMSRRTRSVAVAVKLDSKGPVLFRQVRVGRDSEPFSVLKVRTMVVDAAPEMEAIVEAVRGTLTGNADSLKVHFTTGVSGNAEQWTLELLPIEPRLKVLLASVRLSGRRGELRQVEMRMADGDSSTMAIETLSSVPAGAPAAGPPAAAASRP